MIELMIVVAIIAVLLSLLLPAAASTVRAARGYKCQLAQRAVAFDFAVFADDRLHGWRGEDNDSHRWRLITFQESQYGVDEFWAWGDQQEVRMPDGKGNDPMRCPEVRGDIVLRRDMPCTGGAIQPAEVISFGFNFRLHRPMGPVVRLDSRILEQGNVPLLWDVDGQAAVDRGVVPVFTAPSLGDQGLLASDRYWFPGMRHNGAANFAFIDGHVEASARPLEQSSWGWSYRPR